MSIDAIERSNLVLSAGAVALGFALATPAFALGLAIGAAIEAANFRGLRRSAELVFAGVRPGRFGAPGYAARFGLLALAIGVALYTGAHPVGLVIGLSLIIPAALIEAWRGRPPVDPNAPCLGPDDESWDLWNPWLAHERDPDADPDAQPHANGDTA